MIRWYGVMIAFGFLLASFIATRLAKKYGLNAEKLINCGLICFIGGIIGARLYFVALSWPYFQDHLLEICATWKGGMSIHGGIIGGTAFGWLYCRQNNLPVFRYADIICSVLPLGQAIGRWGNFFNSEAFGKPVASNFPLRLFIPTECRPALYAENEYFHPTFLYESVWDFLLFLILSFVILPKANKYSGLAFMLYIAGYSLGRLLIEPLRVDSIMVAGLAAPLVVSAVALFLSSAAALILFNSQRLKKVGLGKVN